MTALTAPPTTARPPRRLGARLCLGLPALVVAAFGGQLLVTGWFDDRAGGALHVQDVAWGATEGVLLLVALVVLLRRHSAAAALQAVAVVGCLVLAMALTASFDPFTAVLGVLVLAGVALSGPRPRTSRPHRGLLGLTAAAACALVPYAVDAAAQQRAGGTESAELLGYTGAAVWALAVVAVLGVAALRPAGWRVPALSAAAAAAVVGAASLVWPSVASSLGTAGGLVALAWAAGVVAVARHVRD